MNNEWNSEVVTDVSESDITVDQAYDATSSNPQSGTAVAQAVEQAGGTVDQSYNASSANAQSGTAVAQAIAGITPGTTYRAGDAIAISGDNEISVKVDGTTIGIDSTTKELKSLQSIPTVDQTYDATSANAQSGTAVAEAVGTSVNLVQGSGITLTESSGNVTISANAQLPAYSDADSGKVLQVQADGTLAWVTLS